MEEKKKKKKLTLTTSSNKPRSASYYPQSKGKTSVVIEKKTPRRWGEKKFQTKDNFNKPKPAPDFGSKKKPADKNFDIRKIAEERATRRYKDSNKDSIQPKKSTLGREKTFASKRQNKLTLAKVLDDEVFDGKERSLSSVKRARLKAKKNQDYSKENIETKKIVHEVNIPEKITIQELSNRMAMQASTIIKHLLGMGVVATINHTLDADTAEYLVK